MEPMRPVTGKKRKMKEESTDEVFLDDYLGSGSLLDGFDAIVREPDSMFSTHFASNLLEPLDMASEGSEITLSTFNMVGAQDVEMASSSPSGSSSSVPTPQRAALARSVNEYILSEDGEEANKKATHLVSIVGWVDEVEVGMKEIRAFLETSLHSADTVFLNDVMSRILQYLTDVKSHREWLECLYSDTLLAPLGIHKARQLRKDLRTREIQLNAWYNIIVMILKEEDCKSLYAELIIKNQPFPAIVAKGKLLESNPIVVQLVIACEIKIHAVSEVMVECVEMTPASSRSSSQTQPLLELESFYVPLNDLQRGGKILLKFCNGSRKNLYRVRFACKLDYSQNGVRSQTMITSPFSEPFIVITNECQWEESEGALMAEAFFFGIESNSLPWPTIANNIHHNFLRAIRQDQKSPVRWLCRHTLGYIHERFFSSQIMISRQMFEDYWKWFGKALHKLRYQRHVCSLWQSGFIQLAMSRNAVNNALMDKPPGVFMMRFSERNAGAIAISYKTSDPEPENAVRHYLMRAGDTAASKKTLPDFLAENEPLVFILQLLTSPSGTVSRRVYRKDDALEPYYSKRRQVKPSEGYDSRIVVSTNSQAASQVSGMIE